MPLTGLVAEARKRTALINKKTEQIKSEPHKVKAEVKRVIDFSAEIEQAGREKQFHWQECKHLKQAGERNFCKRYVSLCAEEKCSGKYIDGEDTEIDFKRILRGK